MLTRTLLTLILMSLSLHIAAADDQSVTLKDFDDDRSGLSFKDMKLIQVQEGKPVTARIDLILDLPNGLAANNSKLTKEFQGQGGIIDVGEKALRDVKQAPATGYKPALKPDQLIEGHCYCVLAADGRHYAKFQIKRLDKAKRLLEITWQYQAKSSREFE